MADQKLLLPYKPIGAAPQGHFFVGGGGGVWTKKVVTLCGGLRISEKERNPPQADSIGSVFFNRE